MLPHLHIGGTHHKKKDAHTAHEQVHDNELYQRKGKDALKDSAQNKFTGFSKEERQALGLRGLLPFVVEDQIKQEKRELGLVRKKTVPIDKYMHLMALADRNSKLFYSLLMNNVEELMPIVYTPVVGEACIRYSEIHQHSQGLYITLEDAGHVETVLRNWHHPNVKAIVVTDGERILGE